MTNMKDSKNDNIYKKKTPKDLLLPGFFFYPLNKLFSKIC